MSDQPHHSLACTTTGHGPPVVVLHRDLGPIGLEPLVAALATSRTVHVVELPGFGRSPLPRWARTVAHLAALTGHFIDGLVGAPVTVIGLGFGGWVAAELAAYSPSRVRSLVLVSPLGLRPDHGEVTDRFLYAERDYAALAAGGDEGFARLIAHTAPDELDGLLDRARETVTRVAWKPIGHDPALAGLLAAVERPAAVIWGDCDAVVPASTAAQWHALLGGAVEIVPGASHHVELTHPEIVRRHLDASES